MGNSLIEQWRIIRQDSNGARVIEHEHLNEEDANKFVEKREAQIGHHHQSVWKQSMQEPAPYPPAFVAFPK